MERHTLPDKTETLAEVEAVLKVEDVLEITLEAVLEVETGSEPTIIIGNGYNYGSQPQLST